MRNRTFAIIITAFVSAIVISSYVKKSETVEEQSKLKNLEKKIFFNTEEIHKNDSLLVRVKIEKLDDTLIYSNGTFIEYPTQIKLNVNVVGKKADEVKVQVIHEKEFPVVAVKN